MKTWLLFLLIGCACLGCARVSPKPEEGDSSVARTMIREIWEALKTYHCDAGKWAATVEELVQNRYLEIPPDVQEKWRFQMIGGPPQEIWAISAESAESGVEIPKTVMYDVRRGWWKGYGVPRYGTQRLTLPAQTELTIDVIKTIDNVKYWLHQYYADKGFWPESVEELERDHYMEVDMGMDSTWQFAIIGTPPQAIVAVSKSGMPDGAGRAVEYDIASGTWRGYGQP